MRFSYGSSHRPACRKEFISKHRILGRQVGRGTHIKLAASDEWPSLGASAGKPGRLDFLRGQFKNLREGLFTSSASY